MELWTGALSWWKYHCADFKSAGLFRQISSWTPLKPQHSNPNPNPLANQLWCIDFVTPLIPLIISHRLPAFLESLMPLKSWCSIHARCSKSSLKHSIGLKQNSSRPNCIFEIHQLWQSAFSRMYSDSCCICLFEPEIIKIGQSSHKMYSKNILNISRVYDNFKCLYKKSLETYRMPRIYIFACVRVCVCVWTQNFSHI